MKKGRARFDLDEKTLKVVDDMVVAEQHYLAERARLAEGEGSDPAPIRRISSRRHFMAAAAAGLVGAGVLPKIVHAAVPPGAVDRYAPADPSKVPGTPTGDDGGYGSRSQFETEVRWRFPTPTKESSWTMTPLGGSMGIITPSGLHYERHHSGIATIDPAKHVLYVHGMVERPKKYSMADIKRMPSISRTHMMECSGNGLTEWTKPTLKTVQGTHGLTSTSEWTGVPMALIMKEVGVMPGAKWVLAEGDDGAVMTRSLPIEKMYEDAFLAYGQNGEALRPEQGYPLRINTPGWEGNTSIKWVRRLEFSDVPFETREETSKYTDLMPNGKARQFTFVMEAKSVITFPSGEMKLPGPGFYEVTGLAWSGRGKITRVEVSANGGQTWSDAQMQGPVLPICHTRFRLPWYWDGKPAILQSRCTDETGYVQPTIKQLTDVRGTNGPIASIYHLNGIQSWAVAANGSVSNVHHF
jgi:sulfane dehydrogenase subunit SoxC